MFQFNILILPLLVSIALIVWLIVQVWRLRHTTTVIYFELVMFCLLIWTVNFVFELASIELQTKIFFANLQFFGIEFLPMSWLCLILSNLGFSALTHKLIPYLVIVPVLDLTMLWTDPMHHLFRLSPHLDSSNSVYTVLVNDYGPWCYWVEAPYLQVLFVISLIVLVKGLSNNQDILRKQIWMLLVGSTIPLVVNFGYLAGITPIPNFNFTPIVFSAVALILGLNMFLYRFLDFMPIARSVLLETLDDSWIAVDIEDRVVDLNKKALALIGKEAGEVIGKKADIVLEKYHNLVLCLQLSHQMEEELQLANGDSTQWYDLRIIPLLDTRGRFSGRLLILHEITERKQMETALLEQERLRIALQKEYELSEFRNKMMSRISHEFRTPLTVILSSNELLENYFDRMTEEKKSKNFERVRSAVYRLNMMLEDISFVVRNEQNRVEINYTRFDLEELTRDNIGNLLKTTGNSHSILLSVHSDLQNIIADERMYTLIINNLLLNAINYSAKGSKIWLDLKIDREDLIIRIKDEGIGILDQDKDRVFDPFFRGNNIDEMAGIGLGLSIVKNAVERLAGKVSFETELNRGTTFTVTLPIPEMLTPDILLPEPVLVG